MPETSTNPQTLLAAADCFACYGESPAQLQLMKLALLAQLVKTTDPSMDTSPNTLLAQASCFACYANSPGLMSLMELGLLNLIAQNGGGGGGSGQIVPYTGADPNSDGVTPTNLNAAAIAVKPSATEYIWDPVNHIWT